MYRFPRHSAVNEHVLTNEWNNSLVDNVSGGVQYPSRDVVGGMGGETQRGRQRAVSLHFLHFPPVLSTHSWALSRRLLYYFER